MLRHVLRPPISCFQRQRYTTTTAKHPELFDVICVGGGPVGLSLLAALHYQRSLTGDFKSQSRSGRESRPGSPEELETTPKPILKPGQLFNTSFQIGAWRHVQASRVQPYHEMQVWDAITGSRISFDWDSRRETPHAGQQQKVIALMTENLNLSSALLARLDELGGAVILDNTNVVNIELGQSTGDLDLASWPVVEVSGGRKLAARLLIGADGGNSPVRAFAGIKSRGWDYEQHGIVAIVKLEGYDSGGDGVRTAYQRFLPTGPVALLPLPGDLSTLVWSTTSSRAAHLRTLSTEDFVAMTNAAFRLPPVDLTFMHTQDRGQVEELRWREKHTHYDHAMLPQHIASIQDGSVASFPLRMRHADTYVGERVTLVGDAAHTIHPLAGQGLNQGQGDVEILVQTLGFAVEHGQDIGTQLSLETYSTKRYSSNSRLIGVVDKLHKLYSVSSGPLVPLRSLGLSAVNAIRPLKAFLMRRAAGLEQ